MFQTSLSATDVFSHVFLTKLAKQNGLKFRISENVISTNLPLQDTNSEDSGEQNAEVFEKENLTHKLTISAEALNLEKLCAVQRALQQCVKIAYFHPRIALDNPDVIAIQAAVSVVEEESIAQVLDSVADKLQLELSLLARVPSLNEPGLLLMDMDSTVIDIECIDEIAMLAGVGKEVSDVTELAMQGKLDFSESLIHRVACLKQADVSILESVRNTLPLMPGITRLIAVLKAHNWKVAIASGGFTYFADYLADRLALDAAISNKLEIENNRLTGKVIGNIVDANVKADTLKNLAKKWNIPMSQTVAMGDGANDLPMMERAALGVAFKAKPVVRARAHASIRFGGLDQLLWLLDSR